MGWMLASTLAVAGIAGVVLPADRRIRDMTLHAHQLYELANRNDRIARSAIGLAAASLRVSRDVTDLSGRPRAGVPTIGALALVQDDIQRFHLMFEGFTPVDRLGDSGAPARVAIAIRGTYEDVVGAVADFSKHDTLLEVRDVTLTQSPDEMQQHLVDATVEASVYANLQAAETEQQHADDGKH